VSLKPGQTRGKPVEKIDISVENITNRFVGKCRILSSTVAGRRHVCDRLQRIALKILSKKCRLQMRRDFGNQMLLFCNFKRFIDLTHLRQIPGLSFWQNQSKFPVNQTSIQAKTGSDLEQ
jgi:hypothetical protein